MATETTAAHYRAELDAAAPPADGLWYRPGEDGFRLVTLIRLAEAVPTFTPTIRRGQMVRSIHGTRPLGRALSDSFMGRDCFGETVEFVHYQRNPSGRDVHTCKAYVRSVFVIAEA